MADINLKPSQFTDADGTTWTVDINIDSIEQVKAETNVSVYELLNEKCKPLAELLANMPAFAHVGYILVGAEAAGVDRKTFLRGLKGDPFARMVDAFLEELKLFFPDHRRRAAIAQMTKAWQSFENLALNQMTDAMAKVDPDELAQTVLTKMLSTKSGDSPATSASPTPPSLDA